MSTFRFYKTGGGWFVGLRWHSATQVISSRWKFVPNASDVEGKFVKVPDHYVWHLDIGLLTHTLSIYIRRQIK